DILAQLELDKTFRYDVTAEQAKQAEAHLALPLSALAPRLRYLEKQLAKGTVPIRLAVEPAGLFERLEKASGGPVKVWGTSLRILRTSLPKDEGGVDESQRWAQTRQQMIPWVIVDHHLRDMKLLDELPRSARGKLSDLISRLFTKYDIVPHERITRG